MIKKLLISILLLFIINVTSFAQGDWELLIPLPTSNQMVSLYFIDEHTGWSVGEYGTILKTTDGGESWRIIELDLLTDLADVHFPTATVGYIVGTDGLILKSTDAGEKWIQQYIYYSNNLHRIRFSDEQTGWIIGEHGLILFTDDGGTTWQQQISNVPDDLYGLQIVDTNKVCIVGNNGAILLTEDNGQNWQIIPYEEEYRYYDVYFSDENRGWLCGKHLLYAGQNGIIAKTLDGGKHWQTIERNGMRLTDNRRSTGTEGDFFPLQQIYFSDDTLSGVCLTSHDAAWDNSLGNFPVYSSDGGKNWLGYIDGQFETYPCKGRFQFLTETHVIATGFHGDYRFSDDGGENWYYKNSEKRRWWSLDISDSGEMHAIVISDPSPKHFFSINFGTNWEEITPIIYKLDGSQKDLQNMTSLGNFTPNSGTRLWLTYKDWNDVLSDYSVLYSDDLGRTYHEVRSGVEQKMTFLTEDTLIAYYLDFVEVSMGKYKSVLKILNSYDGGVNIQEELFHDLWNDLTPPDYWNSKKIRDTFFFNSRVGFLIGSEGNILKTENTGQSWENIYSGVVEDLWDIEFINRKTGFIVGSFGRILKTEDGGETWRKTNSGTQEDIHSIAFLNANNGWVGTESGMRYTTDGGETWHGIPLRYNHGAIHNVHFDSKGNGYAYTFNAYAGSHVMFLRMLNDASGIHDYNEVNPSNINQISLFPNYPNPFNTSTRFEYFLPQAGVVRIKIFNMQGQLVCTLVNQFQKSGHHSTIWNGYTDTGLSVSSGVYFYQLQCNNQIKNRKLLLLK